MDIRLVLSMDNSVTPLVTLINRVLGGTSLEVLAAIHKLGEDMTAAMQRLTDSLAKEKDAIEAMRILLGTLAQEIRDNADDPVALNAMADQIDAESGTITDAIVQDSNIAGVTAPTNQPAKGTTTGGLDPDTGKPIPQ